MNAQVTIGEFESEQLLDDSSPFWEEFYRREAKNEGRMAVTLATRTRFADRAGEYARRAATAGARALAIGEARLVATAEEAE